MVPVMRDRHFATALHAPDVGQQPLADIGGNRFPALAGGAGEIRKILNGDGLFLRISTCATTKICIQPEPPQGGQAIA